MARPKKETAPDSETQSLEAVAALEQKLAEAKSKVKFNFQKQAQKIHSLYKLLPAMLQRNVSYNTSPVWESAEHVHFFHSISSDGHPQIDCVPIGGHFHEMILVTPATEDSPAVYRCSPPLKKVRQKNARGEWEVVKVPSNANDQHTHEVEYKHSEIWSPPQLHPEFIKMQTQLAAKIVRSEQFVEQ